MIKQDYQQEPNSTSSSSQDGQKRPKTKGREFKYKMVKNLKNFKVLFLNIQTANRRIISISKSNPTLSQNLRWVKNNFINREILAEELIKSFIIRRLTQNAWNRYFTPLYYSTVYNLFTMGKPKEEVEHNSSFDPLTVFLDEHQRAEIFQFKKELREKNRSLSKDYFSAFLKSKLLVFFKSRISLKKVDKFISALPRMSGCFQLPLIKEQLDPGVEDYLLLSSPKFPLELKVYLTGHNNWTDGSNKTPLNSPKNGKKRGRKRQKKKPRKKNKSALKKSAKRIKVDFLTPEKSSSSLSYSLFGPFKEMEAPLFAESEKFFDKGLNHWIKEGREIIPFDPVEESKEEGSINRETNWTEKEVPGIIKMFCCDLNCSRSDLNQKNEEIDALPQEEMIDEVNREEVKSETEDDFIISLAYDYEGSDLQDEVVKII